MKNYVIVTDSGSDLSGDILKKLNVTSLPLSVKFEGENEISDYGIEPQKFYKKIRDGKSAKTAAVNYMAFLDEFRKIAKRGYDILYIGLSSAISSTYSAAHTAALSLRKELPGTQILVLDSKCASAGLGLLVYLTAKKRDDGGDIFEAFKYAENLAPRICHRFTVDDLSYLHRGGRISGASAFFGNILGIKPLLYVDSGGFLKSSEKVRGRRGAIEALANTYVEFGGTEHENTVFISHADCRADAGLLDEYLYKKYGCRAKKIFDIGAVIGAHAGPGTLALFFIGNVR